jgi:quercetin dioxygenase-like cupin family protein
MAYPNKFISNPKTGQSFLFVQTAGSTDGALLEIESSFAPHSKEPPAHYHPFQEEDFIITEGQLTVRINGQTVQLKKGDTLHVPANTVHAMWNDSREKTTVNWKVRPALNSEHLFETLTGLAIDNKTNENGVPAFLQSVLIVKKFSAVFRPAKPAYGLLKIVFALLAPIGLLLGYKAMYEKYID